MGRHPVTLWCTDSGHPLGTSKTARTDRIYRVRDLARGRDIEAAFANWVCVRQVRAIRVWGASCSAVRRWPGGALLGHPGRSSPSSPCIPTRGSVGSTRPDVPRSVGPLIVPSAQPTLRSSASLSRRVVALGSLISGSGMQSQALSEIRLGGLPEARSNPSCHGWTEVRESSNQGLWVGVVACRSE